MELENVPQPVLMRAVNHAMKAIDQGMSADTIRDAIIEAIYEERERCAKIAESNHQYKGKRVAASIRGTRRR